MTIRHGTDEPTSLRELVPPDLQTPLPAGSNPDAVGVRIGDLRLDCGRVLPDVVIAVQSWGRRSADGSNAVLVEHALTGDAHVVGPAGPGQPTAGWWVGLVGPQCPIDTDRWWVVAANVLGGCRGSTGPATPAPDGAAWGSRFPPLTIRDQVRAEAALAHALGVQTWALVVGGSMGGMRVSEWIASFPERCRAAAVIASGAHATADQIAWGHAQSLAITGDRHYAGGDYYGTGASPAQGLALARQIAHTTYRSASELQDRFGIAAQDGEEPLTGGRFAVQSYLDHHGAKLVQRFDPGSYLTLTRAMATHDIGRGRGGMTRVLRRYRGRLLVAGVDTDRLFPIGLSHDLAAAHGHRPARVVRSAHGHDGFLIEVDQIGALVGELLNTRSSARHPQVG